jgi:hypothetical protein
MAASRTGKGAWRGGGRSARFGKGAWCGGGRSTRAGKGARVDGQLVRLTSWPWVEDRLAITGARRSLPGAEAVLLLRAVITNGNFEAYWSSIADAPATVLCAVAQMPPTVRLKTARLVFPAIARNGSPVAFAAAGPKVGGQETMALTGFATTTQSSS